MRKIAFAALIAGITVMASPAAQADGDAEKGRVLAYTCLGCHGIDGYRNAYPSYRVPRLGGQHADYLVAALQAYKTDSRKHETMSAQAKTLSDQDMADLAAFFAGYNQVDAGAAVVQKPGQEKSLGCAGCHGANGVSAIAMYPTIAGQHAEYIVHALEQYRSGERQNAFMSGMAAPLSDADIAALAEFFAAQPGLKTTKEE
jgi:cytochrome c553